MPDAPLEVSIARLEVQVKGLAHTLETLEPMVRSISEWVAERRGMEPARLADTKRSDNSDRDHGVAIEELATVQRVHGEAIKALTRGMWAIAAVLIAAIVGAIVRFVTGM